MAFYKFTSISGRKEDGSHKCLTVNGHWHLGGANRAARRSKIVGPVEIEYCVADMSGHGRGGHDGRWIVDEDGTRTKIAKWSEFCKEHD